MFSFLEKGKFKTKKPSETKKLGEKFGAFLKKNKKNALVFLEGPLGSGKTIFVKGIARALKIKANIKSPSFLLERKYKISKNFYFYHFDFYRLKNKKEIQILSFKKLFEQPNKINIVVVEWPKFKDFLKPNFRFSFKIILKNEREILYEKIYF